MWYHATPKKFDMLKEDSWVSNSKLESCLHLLMKNIKENRDRLSGYLISVDDPYVSSEYDINERLRFGQTHRVFDVTRYNRESVKEVIKTFPENQQWIFYADHIVDLIPYLNG